MGIGSCLTLLPRASVKVIYEIAYSCIGINCFNIYIVQSMSIANEMSVEKLQAGFKREKLESSLNKASGCGYEATFTQQYTSIVHSNLKLRQIAGTDVTTTFHAEKQSSFWA